MISKYDTIREGIFIYIWNRMTAIPCIDDRVLAAEIIEKYPTWVSMSDVKQSMQIEFALWLIEQARFYRQRVTVKLGTETSQAFRVIPNL